jgi:hypothetical protein
MRAELVEAAGGITFICDGFCGKLPAW